MGLEAEFKADPGAGPAAKLIPREAFNDYLEAPAPGHANAAAADEAAQRPAPGGRGQHPRPAHRVPASGPAGLPSRPRPPGAHISTSVVVVALLEILAYSHLAALADR